MSALRKYSEPVEVAPSTINFPAPANATPPRKTPEEYLADLQRKVVPRAALLRGWELLAQLAADPQLDTPPAGFEQRRGWRQALAICMLMYVCPLRATAFGRLQWKDITQLERGMRVSKLDKGKKTTLLEIDAELWARLEPVLQSFRVSECADAFVFGDGLSRSVVEKAVKRATRVLAGREYSAHWLRHTFACHLIELAGYCNWGLAEAISKQLGHTHRDGTVNVATTLRYYRRVAEWTDVTKGLVA